MNRINVKKIIISSLLLVSGNILFAQQNFSSKTFSLSIDGIGNITALETLSAGKNLVTKDSAGVLLQLVKDGKRYKPGVFQIFEIKLRVLSILFWQEPQFLTSYYFS